MDFERIFRDYYAVLEKHKEQLYKFYFYPENINEIKKSLTKNEDVYSYNFSTIRLFIPQRVLPSHSIPRELGGVEIVLSIKDEIAMKKINNCSVEDPFITLNRFNIVLYCENKQYTSSWHLDRHNPEENEASSSILHPIYHLTFGGYHMEDRHNLNQDVFGNTLILRAPRIMHPPMEVILGMDFIFNHFIPKSELDLLTDPLYLAVIKELKKNIWLPFSLAIAKNYCERIAIDNHLYTFDNTFVTSVLG